MASLEIQNISKTFGKTSALKNVSLKVSDGQYCVLLGPSGCGKSTLLYIMAGLIPQDKGQVFLDHKNIDHLYPGERDIAMVFQNYALYPHMNVEKNLSFGLRMRKTSPKIIAQRIENAANLLGIRDLLQRKPSQLSGGQRQRVAMGRALVRRPKLFLLDEPLSNLDARLRSSVRMELKDLHQRIKGTMIHVTHDQIEAMTLGDQVVVMKDGGIRQIGTPYQIYNQPYDTFVATFIGSPQMNLLSGKIQSSDEKLLFQGQGISLEIACPTKQTLDPGEVEIGFRPEDVKIENDSKFFPKAQVNLISDLGSLKLLQLNWGEAQITVTAEKEISVKPDDFLGLGIAFENLHIFQKGIRINP